MKDNPQAYPMHERDDALRGIDLLSYYAGQAMQGMETDRVYEIIRIGGAPCNISDITKRIAEASFSMAEAMLKEREKRINND